MNKFDSDSIYANLLKKLQQNPDWRVIANNSVVSSILRSNAEVNAETARYAEYLFKESKWDTAQNNSSILAMANMLGYQPKRKISARGSIYVSLDPRTHLIGKSLPAGTFSIEGHSKLKQLGWVTPDTALTIPIGTPITCNKGIDFIALPTTYSENSYYKILNIIQGVKRSVSIKIDTIRNVCTASRLDPYLYIPVTLGNCEDASNPTSKAFFRVKVNYGSGVIQEYRVVDSLLLSKASDRDVEVYNDLYSQKLFYLKFNNDPNRGPVLDISKGTNIENIEIEYIESRGKDGNLSKVFENFTLTTTYGGKSVKLYGVNLEPISNGKNEESVADIKRNAPRYYITNYTTGTREAYEKSVLNMELKVDVGNVSTTLVPSAVQVFAGSSRTDSSKTVTKISFLADGLDDLLENATGTREDISSGSYQDDILNSLDESLNYCLDKLKSPQDTLEFHAPTFIDFALGVTCKVDPDATEDLGQLEENIRNFIEEEWATTSEHTNFNRSFYPSQISTQIMNKYPSVISLEAEVEAITKADWSKAARKQAKSVAADSSSDTSLNLYTVRIPFDFNPIFKGSKAVKGFKDARSGSTYTMRVDVLYKTPISYTSSNNHNVSIFIEDNASRGTQPFFIEKETSEEIWNIDSFVSGGNQTDYSMLMAGNAVNLKDSSTDSASHCKQYLYRSEVYNDNGYRSLLKDTEDNYIDEITSPSTVIGALADYLIYFNPKYSSDDLTSSGSGWIEVPFDSLYAALQEMSIADRELRSQLNECPLSMLKCGTTDTSGTNRDLLKTFLGLANKYIDIYVCMRPVDSDLNIGTLSEDIRGGNVLQIDTTDSYVAGDSRDFEKLSNTKRPRMISVSCSYEK